MASDEIHELQTTRDKLRAQARCSGTDETWAAFRTVCNRINPVIGRAKRAFLNTTLSSKRLRDVRRVIHRVIHPSPSPICADPDQLNGYFIKTTERTLGTLPDEATDLVDLIDSLPDPIVILSSSALYLLGRFSKRLAYLDWTVLLALTKFPSNM